MVDEQKDNQKLLNISEVASDLHYTERTIRDMLKRGEIKGTQLRPRGKWLVSQDDLNLYKSNHSLLSEKIKEQCLIQESDRNSQTESNIRQWEVTQKQIEHDTGIFEKFDSILNESDLKRIVRNLNSGNAIYLDDDSKVARFFDFVNLSETNKYLVGDLRNSFLNFVGKLDSLEGFMGINFYPSSDVTTKSELWVTGDKKYKFDWDDKTWERYHHLGDELHEKANLAYEAYQKYREIISNLLQVTSAPAEKDERIIAHDLKIFEEYDSIWQEKGLSNFLSLLNYGHHIWDLAQIAKLNKLLSLSKLESNKYINQRCQVDCEHFAATIERLSDFLLRESRPRDPGEPGETQFKLRPDLRHPEIPEFNVPQNEWGKAKAKYDKLETKLFELSDDVKKAFSEYRATIRETLYV